MQDSTVGTSAGDTTGAAIVFGLTFALICILLIIFTLVWHRRRARSERNDAPTIDSDQAPEQTNRSRTTAAIPHVVHSQSEYRVDAPTPYQYARRTYMMTERERQFYRRLYHVFGKFYLIFPQVHLNDLLEYDQVHQNWQGALSTIQRKSVDYVLCTTDFKIMLAIELDDTTHRQPLRRERDRMVNYIFKEARLPLLRLARPDTMTNAQIHHDVMAAMFESNVPSNQKIQG